MEGETNPVTIVELKCTPSMKSEVYGVCLVFRSCGTYLQNKSKCDCPNGWLFCSHSLAVFLLIRLIKLKRGWTFQDFCDFMPEPIKTLQNLPIAAAMVFKKGCTKKATKAIGRQLAKEVPGYSAAKDSCKDADDKEETEAQRIGLKDGVDVKSITLCRMLDDHLGKSVDVAIIDKRIEGSESVTVKKTKRKEKKAQKEKKVTSVDIHKFNHEIVHGNPEPSRRCKTLLRHNRLQQMMDGDWISSDSALSQDRKSVV